MDCHSTRASVSHGRRRWCAAAGAAMIVIALFGWPSSFVVTAQVLGPRPAAPPPLAIPPSLDSACVRCHAASLSSRVRVHLREWVGSPHGKNGVGCQDCHGGDPESTDVATAHAPAAAVNGLSRTQRSIRLCARCHAQTAEVFERSPHYPLIQAGERLMPSCVTCHGAVVYERVPPERLEAECAQCHGAGRLAPRPEIAPGIRLLLVERDALLRLCTEGLRLASVLPPGPTRSHVEGELTQVEARLHAGVRETHSTDIGPFAAEVPALYRRALDAVGQMLQPPKPKP